MTLLLTLAACAGDRKKPVTRKDFAAVTDYVDKNLKLGTAEDRRKYTVSQLGAPHRQDGTSTYWYSPVSDCYYLQLGEDGWASWGTGATADCKKWAVTP
jgi:hypothetical protein